MKHSLLKSIFTVVIGVSYCFTLSAQEIPNSSFETWVNEDLGAPTGSQHPTGWHTLNMTILVYPFTTTKKSIEYHTGSFSAELLTATQSGPIIGSITMPGILSTAKVDIDFTAQTLSAKGGWAFTGKPKKLTGYYKYQPDNNDTCNIAWILTRWNSNTRDTIAIGTAAYSNAKAGWTLFEVPATYYSNATPDTMNILILNSIPQVNSTHLNTKMWVDDLAFDYTLANIEVKPSARNLVVYVNEETQKLVLDCKFEKISNCSFKLYDIKGNCVSTLDKAVSLGSEYMDISQLTKGVYVLKATSGKQLIDSRKINIH